MRRSNILYIMSDGHAANAISCYGGRLSKVAKTPNYDYCPQTKALGKSKQIPVIPLEDMRVSPAKIPIE